MDERLTKAERIRQRAEYLRIQGSGRKFHTPSFICFGMLDHDAKAAAEGLAGQPPAAPVSSDGPTRLGITVSRRVGCAVTRNRLKRLVREVYRRHKPAFPAGAEFVVIARPEAAKIAYADVERELCEAGRRMRGVAPRGRSQ